MNIALRNVPEDLHAELKAAARRNHRSLNGEILARLMLGQRGATLDVGAFLEENRQWHQRFAALDLSFDRGRVLTDEEEAALLKRIAERRKTVGDIDLSVETVNALKSEGRL